MSNGPYSAPRFFFHTSVPARSTPAIWPVANQAQTRSPPVTGLGDARLCFSAPPGGSPSAAMSNSHFRLPLGRSNALTTKTTRPLPLDEPPPSGRSPASAGSPLCTRRGPGRTTPRPAWDLTNTRLPDTTGDEIPTPRIRPFHATLSVPP